MADVLLTDTNFYNVNASGPIFMTVTIGDGQVGGTAATLNGVPVPVNPTGETTIGTPTQDLRGSILQVITTVRDVNPLTNNTSVTHTFRGGVAPQAFPHAISVNADKDNARYFITYVLT